MGQPIPTLDQEPRTGRSAADWRRAAGGIELAGISVFLLLNSTGALPWSFWLDALRLWPLAIVSVGVRIAFERSKMPWLLLLGPAIVLGGLTWVARGKLPEGPPPEWTPVSAERPADISGVQFEASVAAVGLDLTRRPLAKDVLVEGRSASRHETSVLETGRAGDTGRVLLHGGAGSGRWTFVTSTRDRWDLTLPADLPVGVTLRGAVIRSQVDLSAGPVDGVIAKGAFLHLDLSLPRPQHTVQIQVGGVFNVFRLHVPEGTPVSVRGAGLPFNLCDRRKNGTPSAGNPGYEVRLQGIFSVLTVTTSPAKPTPEAEPGRVGSSS
jgi:hypothetical protein